MPVGCSHVETGLKTEQTPRGPTTSEAGVKSELSSHHGIHGFTHSRWHCKLSACGTSEQNTGESVAGEGPAADSVGQCTKRRGRGPG